MHVANDSQSESPPEIKDLISFSQASQIAGFSDRHLRKLATNHEIWAIKIGRNWFTTEKAIRDYLEKGIKRGPKPKKLDK